MEDNSPRDPIIGLDVGGHHPFFYCHVSTLTNGSSYFASRFIQQRDEDQSAMQPGDCLGRDEFGREVYFVDRNGAVFQYILEYLRNNAVDLPKFQQNPELWLSLRREAAFFCLDGLLSMLQVTFSCSPSHGPCGDRGILYWLGTDRGRSPGTYQNPYLNGAVDVGGLMDNNQSYDNLWHGIADYAHGPYTCREYSKATFVQYRHKVHSSGGGVSVASAGLNLCQRQVGGATFVDLRTARVRPTHYSMRYGDCCGMTSDWVFAGSINGEQWDVLHEAKSESYIEQPDYQALQVVRERLGFGNGFQEVVTEAQRGVLTDWAERHCRRTWKVHDPMSNAFYRFFRIQKVGDNGGLHGTSLEIFGDVNECPDE